MLVCQAVAKCRKSNLYLSSSSELMSRVCGVLGWEVKCDNEFLYLLFTRTTTSLQAVNNDATASQSLLSHWRRGMERRSGSKPVICRLMAASRPTRREAKKDAEKCGRRPEGFAVTMLSIRDVVSARAIRPRGLIRHSM